jgi:hypothetical protein
MPQASEEDRERMQKWFGDMGDFAPACFLTSHGYRLRKDWVWVKPTPSHNMSADERACLRFLIEEWDYGGVVNVKETE